MGEMQALSDVFKLRPEMFMAGMRSLDSVRQEDAQRLQQQELANQQATLQNQFMQENNPIRQEQARFGLMKDRAMFPGDLAESQGKVTKGQNVGNYTPEQIPQVLTHAAAFAMSPGAQTPALHGAMKSMLRNAYIPEIMDNWTPQQFGENLPKMLESYSKLLPKNAAASALQEQKSYGQQQIEEERTRRATSVANIAASTRNRIKASEPKVPNDFGPYATELLRKADMLEMPGATEDDLARAAIFRERGEDYRRRFEQHKINTTPGAVNPAIDPTQLLGPDGKPRFPAKPIPQPTQPTVDSRAIPAKAITTEAEYNSLPSGSLYIVNGVTKRKK